MGEAGPSGSPSHDTEQLGDVERLPRLTWDPKSPKKTPAPSSSILGGSVRSLEPQKLSLC